MEDDIQIINSRTVSAPSIPSQNPRNPYESPSGTRSDFDKRSAKASELASSTSHENLPRSVLIGISSVSVGQFDKQLFDEAFRDVKSRKISIEAIFTEEQDAFQAHLDFIKNKRVAGRRENEADASEGAFERSSLPCVLCDMMDKDPSVQNYTVTVHDIQSPGAVQSPVPTEEIIGPQLSLEHRKMLVIKASEKLQSTSDIRKIRHFGIYRDQSPPYSEARVLISVQPIPGRQPSAQSAYPRSTAQSSKTSRRFLTPKSHPSQLSNPGSRTLPYLGKAQRDQVQNIIASLDWGPFKRSSAHSSSLHIPMSEAEVRLIISTICDIEHLAVPHSASIDCLTVLLISLRTTRSLRIQIAKRVKQNTDLNRTASSIVSFLDDVVLNQTEDWKWTISSTFAAQESKSVAFYILGREIGDLMCGRRVEANIFGTMGPALSFKQMSGDVNCVSFGPNGNQFAVGGCCFEDEHSEAYNRSGNLILGNIETEVVHELPDHYLLRQGTDLGMNPTDATLHTEGSRVWQTISGVEFDATGKYLLSAGRDSKLRIYDVENDTCLTHTRDLGSPVDILKVNKDTNLAATGASKATGNISIWRFGEDANIVKTFDQHSSRFNNIQIRTDYFPTSLEWGTGSNRHLLIAGFGENEGDERDSKGHLCIWDCNHDASKFIPISPQVYYAFATAWSPANNLLASANTGSA
jgi:WD40 repeat protein